MRFHKKAQHAVILSISVSFIFIALSSYFASSFDRGGNRAATYNIRIMSNGGDNAEGAIALSQYLIDISQEKKYQVSIGSGLQVNIDKDEITDEYQKASDSQRFSVQFYLLDKETYNQYAKDKRIDYGEPYYYVDEKLAEVNQDSIVVNEISPFKKNQILLFNDESLETTIPITSVNRKPLQDRAFSVIRIYTNKNGLAVLQQAFKDDCPNYSINIMFQSKRPYQLEKMFQKLKVKENIDLNINNMEAINKRMYAMFGVIQLFLSFLAGFLLMMMTINIIVTMVISLLFRKAEFARLRSIGMSGKQLRTMILNEYLNMALKGIIVGNILGYSFSYLLYLIYMHTYGSFYYPWSFMLVFSFVILVMAIVLAIYTKQLMSKGSLYQALQRNTIEKSSS